MTKKELKLVRAHITSVYASWHCCALKKHELAKEDRKRGLKTGQLCDDCNSMIDAHMKDIESAATR